MPQQLAELLELSAEHARGGALLRTVEGPEEPLELDWGEWGRVRSVPLLWLPAVPEPWR